MTKRIPNLGHSTEPFRKIEGDDTFDFDIVGESFYQDALSEICGGKTDEGREFYCVAYLTPEPDNPYDKNAVAIYIENLKVGHLSKGKALAFSDVMKGNTFSVDAVIVGGWKKPDGDEGSFGVKLDL